VSSQPHRSVPGLDPSASDRLVELLADRLAALIDLQLTLKHIHWNVVGPSFLSVHEMLDHQVGPVRSMTDALAERMRALGGVPVGTPASVVARRDWDDYDLLTASVYVHLKALAAVYDGVIADHRRAIEGAGADPVTEDLLISQTGSLEHFQWFVRSFVERSGEPQDPAHVAPPEVAADRRDADAVGAADRPPTGPEEDAADRAAADVDLERTGEAYREMTSTGASVKGEGAL
jgi:starvation-inducible DNA-binding protein